MTLRQIAKTSMGQQYGLDKTGNPVWNRNDGVQMVLDADATTGLLQAITSIPGTSPAQTGYLVPKGIGTAATMLAITAPAVGALWFASDLACEFIGKTNPAGGTFWAPRGGRQPLYQRSGSIAAPLVTINTGITAATYTLPNAGNLTIPANLLVSGLSRLAFRMHHKRAGANASLSVNIRLGTNGTTSDNVVATATQTTTNVDFRAETAVGVSGATTYTTLGLLLLNTTGLGVSADRSTAFNVASANIITVDLSGVNASDGPFSIISFEVDILG